MIKRWHLALGVAAVSLILWALLILAGLAIVRLWS